MSPPAPPPREPQERGTPGQPAPQQWERTGTVDVTLYVQHPADAAVEGIERVMHEVARRAEAALDGLYRDLPARVHVDMGLAARRHIPIFPVMLRGERFDEPTDIHEAIAAMLSGTDLDLEGVFHDAGGRAYRAAVRVSFQRQPTRDGQPTRQLPGSGRAGEAP